mgnify:CR=1 FL=1
MNQVEQSIIATDVDRCGHKPSISISLAAVHPISLITETGRWPLSSYGTTGPLTAYCMEDCGPQVWSQGLAVWCWVRVKSAYDVLPYLKFTKPSR